jgi:hypothetical protein
MCTLFTTIYVELLRHVTVLRVVFAGIERKPLIIQIMHGHLCTAMLTDCSELKLDKMYGMETEYSRINFTALLAIFYLELGKFCKKVGNQHVTKDMLLAYFLVCLQSSFKKQLLAL